VRVLLDGSKLAERIMDDSTFPGGQGVVLEVEGAAIVVAETLLGTAAMGIRIEFVLSAWGVFYMSWWFFLMKFR
jgi:hypothetical protein